MTLAMTIVADSAPRASAAATRVTSRWCSCSRASLGSAAGRRRSSELDWRWIFYVNLPVGAAALAAIRLGTLTAPARGEGPRPQVDRGRWGC